MFIIPRTCNRTKVFIIYRSRHLIIHWLEISYKLSIFFIYCSCKFIFCFFWYNFSIFRPINECISLVYCCYNCHIIIDIIRACTDYSSCLTWINDKNNFTMCWHWLYCIITPRAARLIHFKRVLRNINHWRTCNKSIHACSWNIFRITYYLCQWFTTTKSIFTNRSNTTWNFYTF